MAKLSFDLAAATAAFLAKGAKIIVVAEGEKAIENEKAVWRAMREGGRVAADTVVADRSSEYAAHAQRDAFDAAKYDGWNTADAHAYSQEAK